MMKRQWLWVFAGLVFCAFFASKATGQHILKGFKYADVKAPKGDEWNSPQQLALNKEQPKTYFFPFAHVRNARKVLPENSKYWKSLNGIWNFHFSKRPNQRPEDFYKPEYDVSGWDSLPVPSSWNIEGIQKDGTLKYGVPIYVNQQVIFQHSVKVGDWKGGVMRTPPKDWTTYEYRNEVGSFRRTFDIPKSWDGREVYIRFGGVYSFFYLWINGHYVGFSKNARNAARFNITKYLKEDGENVLAVEVYRISDGTFLEAQDMFRLPGIYRTVSLYSTPKVQINDLRVTPHLGKDYESGSLTIDADIRNLSEKKAKGYTLEYALYRNELYSDENSLVKNVGATATVAPLKEGEMLGASQAVIQMDNPYKWSAGKPYRYILIAKLKDKKGKTVEIVPVYTGFREVEIKYTPAEEDEYGLAGRYFYVNGETVRLRGVNRHETNPEVGKAITRSMMRKEMGLLKRANINHVRNAHYPDDPYWYYLCGKYGIYLVDEANLESHEYYYGDASLSHPIEFRPAHVARVMQMVHATYNSPAIVMWSLGNEAGPGKNFLAAYNAVKKVDTTRPVHYERNNDDADVGSNMYPSVAWVRGVVSGDYNVKYPFYICEYAHSMGNASGDLAEYWEAIESSNFLFGAAIWDWIDQSMYNYDSSGTRYLAYGGDFGDKPNSGQFVMNGLLFANYEPKPQYYEVKKVYQSVVAESVDVQEGKFEVFNKFYFKDLSGYNIGWTLLRNGESVQSRLIENVDINPREKKVIQIPYDYESLDPEAEYFVNIKFKLAQARPWADKGYVQGEEQFLVKTATEKPYLAEVVDATDDEPLVYHATDQDIQIINGDNFTVKFDTEHGTIYSLEYGNEMIIPEGRGPRINAFRAFTNNDNWAYQQWFANGLHNLDHTAKSSQFIQNDDGTISVLFTVISQALNAARILGGTISGRNSVVELTDQKFGPSDFKFVTQQIWTVYPDGSVELRSSISSNKPNVTLAGLGYVMNIPENLSHYTYYGRGPHDNYADRKTGSFIQRYESTVAEQFVNFPKPQDMGNREDVRWTALTNDLGNGAVFISTKQEMAISALPYSAMDLILAPHPYQLPEPGDTYLQLDAAVTGLGGNSCGQGPPLKEDRVKAEPTNFGFIIRPVTANQMTEVANVNPSGKTPLSITRDRAGNVSIHAVNPGIIKYQVNDGEVKTYHFEKINLRDGGSVTAWYENDPKIKSSSDFAEIEGIPVIIMNASSAEPGAGDAKHFIDGDLSSIWHTGYSKAVATYPHWVDFDMGEERIVKGFTYLPRQRGSNGDIKEYSILVSDDAENWTTVIERGTFENSKSKKKVLFDEPVEARYFRFKALSEQHGRDFASGAAFTILEE